MPDSDAHSPEHASAERAPHASSVPSAAADRAPRAAFVPRGLVFLGAIWALAAWFLLFGTKPPLQSQAASYAPSMQLFVTVLAVGVSAGWPLLRLAGAPSLEPARQSAIDAVALFTLAQIVVWPLRLVTTWTIPRTIAIDCALAASIASIAAVLACAHGSRSIRTRTLVLAATTGATLLPGALAVLGSASDRASELATNPLVLACSPPALLATVAAPDPVDPDETARNAALAAMAISVALWAFVGIFSPFRASAAR